MPNLQETLKLFPGFYDTSTDSNINKIMQVVTEELQKVEDLFIQISELTDINNVFGATLDLLGADHGVKRDGRDDTDYRSFIQAKINNSVDGNTITNVINYFASFLPISTINLTELFIGALGGFFDGLGVLDGTGVLEGAGERRPAAFDVQVGVIDPELETSLTNALVILKSAGVKATINLLP